MDGTFGTADQRAMQRRADAQAPVIARTPGLAYSGRLMCCDDIDALGWDAIRGHLTRDGIVGFRSLDANGVRRVRDTLESETVSVHSWDGFGGDAEGIAAAIAPILARPLAEGIRFAPADSEILGQMQAFVAAEGISPVSKASLGGAIFPASVRVLMDTDGQVVACGWIAVMNNAFSPLGRTAWIGLLAVAERARGKGLGLRICAETLHAGLTELQTPHVIGFAALDNAPSKAMLGRCGMTPQPFFTVIAAKGGNRPSK